MSHQEAFQQALKTDNKLISLRQAVIALRSIGIDKQILLIDLETFRNWVATEADEDVVLEVMDFLVGHCSPHMRID